jgi:hypothetical protein
MIVFLPFFLLLTGPMRHPFSPSSVLIRQNFVIGLFAAIYLPFVLPWS